MRFPISKSIAIAIAAFIIGNVAMDRLAAQTSRRKFLVQADATPPADCMFLGSSNVQAGADTAAFEAAWPGDRKLSASNFALGQTSPVEHALLFKRALARGHHPRFLVYGFRDDQLNLPFSSDWSELVGNRVLSYYDPEAAAAFYAPGSRIEPLRLALIGHLPLLAERSTIYEKIRVLNRDIGDFGRPKMVRNRFGVVADFDKDSLKRAAAFQSICEASLDKDFASPVREIFRIARERDIVPILVEMPVLSRLQKTIYSIPAWVALRAHLKALAEKDGVLYWSAHDWCSEDAHFEDLIHLNPKGAEVFSARMARELAALASRTPDKPMENDAVH